MKYSLPSDLWSAGVMAYQLVTGRLPFCGEEGEEVSTQYMQTQRFEHKVRPGAAKQLARCFGKQPAWKAKTLIACT